jgi:hypothetical protein
MTFSTGSENTVQVRHSYMIFEIKKFFEEMKNNPKRAVLYAVVTVALFVGASFVSSWIGSFFNKTDSLNIEAEKSNVAVGNSAPVSQMVNVNEEATYTWVNEKNWVADAGDGQASGTYQVNLLFVASGPVYPVSPCLYIRTNGELKSIGPIGASTEWAKGITHQGVYFRCYVGLSNSVTFQAHFSSEPTQLEAALVQDDRGLDLKGRGEAQFMLPVIN